MNAKGRNPKTEGGNPNSGTVDQAKNNWRCRIYANAPAK